MTEPIDLRERRELCDLLVRLGPDAPTLCEGWATLDLAAHLTLREHFRRWGAERMAHEKSKGLPALVHTLRGGAPLIPWRVPKVRTLLNGIEYFIHHEDVRRANGLERRADRRDLEAVAWRMLRFSGWSAARQMRPYGLEIRTGHGQSRRFGAADGAVLTGEPTELLLYLSGRREGAVVSLEGEGDSAAALRRTQTSI